MCFEFLFSNFEFVSFFLFRISNFVLNLLEKNDFFEPFKKKGFESICVKLIGSVMDSNSNTPDTQLVNEWIELLDLEEFFEWRIL